MTKCLKKIYDTASHHYIRKRNGLITATIYSKGIFYDLGDLGLKPAPYEFHVPIEHLDNEGKKAFSQETEMSLYWETGSL